MLQVVDYNKWLVQEHLLGLGSINAMFGVFLLVALVPLETGCFVKLHHYSSLYMLVIYTMGLTLVRNHVS